MIPESVKPRISGQRISHNMLKDMNNAWPILWRSAMTVCLFFLEKTHEQTGWR
jgi:hypothetical protein